LLLKISIIYLYVVYCLTIAIFASVLGGSPVEINTKWKMENFKFLSASGFLLKSNGGSRQLRAAAEQLVLSVERNDPYLKTRITANPDS